MNFVNLFISFSGRINRAKYWLAVAIGFLISMAFNVLAFIASQSTVIQIINMLLIIPLGIFACAVGIKRLHDRNKSGWYLLLFYGLPIVLSAASVVMVDRPDGPSITAGVLALLGLVVSVWTLIELGCLRGSIGQNKYGPDPLAPEVLTPPVRTHA
jgi:uncharacterized membrane protein YhaH (DUF805 family)